MSGNIFMGMRMCHEFNATRSSTPFGEEYALAAADLIGTAKE
jgi:hypothetical protein